MFITTYKISINNSYFKLSLQVYLLRNSFHNNRVICITQPTKNRYFRENLGNLGLFYSGKDKKFIVL